MARSDAYRLIGAYAPFKGLANNVPPTMLDHRYASNAMNVVVRNGIIEKRTGYATYKATVTGTPLQFFVYPKFDGTEYVVCSTTSRVYKAGTAAWTQVAVLTATATLDNRASFCHIQDTMIYTDGVNPMKQWDGTTWGTITAWATYIPHVVQQYKDRLVCFNMTEGTASETIPIRIRYSCLGDYDDKTSTGSGFFDAIQGAGKKILNAVPIRDYIGVYKDRSIGLLDYIGSPSYFSYKVQIEQIGLLAQDAVVNLGSYHYFLGNDYMVYRWDGGWELEPVGKPIHDTLRDEINTTYQGRSFMILSTKKKEIILFIPISSDSTPDRMYIYNYEDNIWTMGSTRNMACGGNCVVAGVEMILLGTSTGSATVQYNYSSTNDGSTAINAYWDTPDIVPDQEEYLNEYTRWGGAKADCCGNKIWLSYSTDGGATYTAMTAESLTSTTAYDYETWYFTKVGTRLRLRFANASASSTFKIRFLGALAQLEERVNT